jgi:hypothetical protein
MNLYKISQNSNNDYDTYDSAIVAAESEDAARRIHPGDIRWSARHFLEYRQTWNDEHEKWFEAGFNQSPKEVDSFSYDWVDHIDKVQVELIGVASENVEAGVILASFNAG